MADAKAAPAPKLGVKQKALAFVAAVQRGVYVAGVGVLHALTNPAARKQLIISMGPLLASSAALYFLAPAVAKRLDVILEKLVALPLIRKLPLPKDFDLTERVKTARFTTIGLSFVRQVFSGPLDSLFYANVPKSSEKGFEPFSSEISRVNALAPQPQKVPVPKALAMYGLRTAKTQAVSLLAHFLIGIKAIKKFVAPVLGSFYLYKTGDWVLVLLAIPISLLPKVNIVQAFLALMGIRSMSRELFEPLVLRDESIDKKSFFKQNALTMAAFTLPFYFLQDIPGVNAVAFGLAQAAAAPLAALMLSPGGVDSFTSAMKKTE
ncbi:hypothetical protein DFJ74DRAFT_692916 [Hyaloraphidium curvatum]|nr:hypothetical protein DFJ74DRAFT_692916 [Hyaloraphidium curvatum]